MGIILGSQYIPIVPLSLGEVLIPCDLSSKESQVQFLFGGLGLLMLRILLVILGLGLHDRFSTLEYKACHGVRFLASRGMCHINSLQALSTGTQALLGRRSVGRESKLQETWMQRNESPI